jgi:hypothetical protein
MFLSFGRSLSASSAGDSGSLAAPSECLGRSAPASGLLPESALLEPSSTDQYFWELQLGKSIKTLGFW